MQCFILHFYIYLKPVYIYVIKCSFFVNTFIFDTLHFIYICPFLVNYLQLWMKIKYAILYIAVLYAILFDVIHRFIYFHLYGKISKSKIKEKKNEYNWTLNQYTRKIQEETTIVVYWIYPPKCRRIQTTVQVLISFNITLITLSYFDLYYFPYFMLIFWSMLLKIRINL